LTACIAVVVAVNHHPHSRSLTSLRRRCLAHCSRALRVRPATCAPLPQRWTCKRMLQSCGECRSLILVCRLVLVRVVASLSLCLALPLPLPLPLPFPLCPISLSLSISCRLCLCLCFFAAISV
jgi:hypothetical protein